MNMEIEYSYHPTSIGSDSYEKLTPQVQNNLKSFAFPWYMSNSKERLCNQEADSWRKIKQIILLHSADWWILSFHLEEEVLDPTDG